ncbi:hypothetical protein AGMMS50268_26210 [Spirochaetia bacterium]|nr:hypothetical protein AGMMS50268_26210 [Spirochaetia bacterium]
MEQLRKDMAKDLVNYLDSPAKEKRLAENYTELEQQEDGFSLDFIEPSALYREAYARALYNLGARGDGEGHFFNKRLNDMLEKEPSEKVKRQIERTNLKLNNLRNILSDSAHTRHLYEAFWWIRQAHMLSLAGEAGIDAKAGKALRVQEGKRGYF